MTSLGVNTTLRTKPQRIFVQQKEKKEKIKIKSFFGCCVMNLLKTIKPKLINSQTCKDKIQFTSELRRLLKSNGFSVTASLLFPSL